MMRLGLLASTVSFYVYFELVFAPVSLHLSSWWAGSSIAALAVLVALGVYGFTTATAGRALERLDALDRPARQPAG
jgi:hypothetical protein